MKPAKTQQAIVTVHELTKSYKDVRAVDGISFTVPANSVTGILGGNGAGKTTTISMLLGLLIPTYGTIEILGADMVNNRFAALPYINFSSPYVELPHRLSVYENLDVYAQLYGVRKRKERIAEVADLLDLGEILKRPAGQLSAGQKTRAMLGKALINQPKLLLLDEPTASIDPDTADRLRGMLEEYRGRHGASIILASHNMSEVERLCDNVLMMRQGKIVDSGSPDALIRKYGRANMEEVFLDIARNQSDHHIAEEVPA